MEKLGINVERSISLLTLIGTIVGGWVYLEANFASAADLRAVEKGFNKSMLELRQKSVEDRIFELELKQSQSPRQFQTIDKALLERYKREAEDIRAKKEAP